MEILASVNLTWVSVRVMCNKILIKSIYEINARCMEEN